MLSNSFSSDLFLKNTVEPLACLSVWLLLKRKDSLRKTCRPVTGCVAIVTGGVFPVTKLGQVLSNVAFRT